MRLLLIRHGESVANAEGRRQGQFDSPLSDRGRQQAWAPGWRLADEGLEIAAMYASDLRRAAETAKILAGHLDVPLSLDARWREYDCHSALTTPLSASSSMARADRTSRFTTTPATWTILSSEHAE